VTGTYQPVTDLRATGLDCPLRWVFQDSMARIQQFGRTSARIISLYWISLTVATLHMDDNAEKWMQWYKMKYGLGSWKALFPLCNRNLGLMTISMSLMNFWNFNSWALWRIMTEFESLQYKITAWSGDGNHLSFPNSSKGSNLRSGIKYKGKYKWQWKELLG
jgi:hypothetical protein